jgi:hypothetical protein
MLGIRLSQLYIHDVHDHTVPMMYSLLIMVEIRCSSISGFSGLVLAEEQDETRV